MLPSTIGHLDPFNGVLKQEDIQVCRRLEKHFTKSVSDFERLNDGLRSLSTYWIVRLDGEVHQRLVKVNSFGELITFPLENVEKAS
jgi:hypothetical protein